MTNQEYLDYFEKESKEQLELTRKKNNDYTGCTDDAFANFKVSKAFGVTTVEEGFFVRMTDKFSRLATFIKTGTLLVKDENVGDTLRDISIYATLFKAYLETIKLEVEAPNDDLIDPKNISAHSFVTLIVEQHSETFKNCDCYYCAQVNRNTIDNLSKRQYPGSPEDENSPPDEEEDNDVIKGPVA